MDTLTAIFVGPLSDKLVRIIFIFHMNIITLKIYFSLVEDSSVPAYRWSGGWCYWMCVDWPSQIYHYTVRFPLFQYGASLLKREQSKFHIWRCTQDG